MSQQPVRLGDEVKDVVTGLRGVVISTSQSLYGCDRLYVQPSIGKDGKVPDGFWIDIEAAIVMKAGKVKRPAPPAGQPLPGGPMSRGRDSR